ncbi:pre-mrna splicing factor [Pyrrhoderma noxium]|uniref:Pre-mrna splicing factor n=1 Tax=Pyrrhoderma noxium TaxID=2282107 RepID=A0A286UUI5_9AGAM|nr:pre-mrna splicing factor [Pyrrhoderma noxium]
MSADVEMSNENGVNGHGVNGNATNGDTNGTPDPQSRFATGLILPPPDIKSIIDRTASYVARSATPLQFEDKVREAQRSDPKFAFLNPADPYHAYYRHKMAKISQGEEDEAVVPVAKEEEPVKEEVPKSGIIPLEPPPPTSFSTYRLLLHWTWMSLN